MPRPAAETEENVRCRVIMTEALLDLTCNLLRYVPYSQDPNQRPVRPCDTARVTLASFEYLVCFANMVDRPCLCMDAESAQDVPFEKS